MESLGAVVRRSALRASGLRAEGEERVLRGVPRLVGGTLNPEP